MMPKAGDRVQHRRYGIGTVFYISYTGKAAMILWDAPITPSKVPIKRLKVISVK
jgi:hypothetical protein